MAVGVNAVGQLTVDEVGSGALAAFPKSGENNFL